MSKRAIHFWTRLIVGMMAATARAEIPSTQRVAVEDQSPSVVAADGLDLPSSAHRPSASRPTTAPSVAAIDAGGGVPPAVPAGDDSPELMLFKDIPVVVAAGKREQTTTEAPASITVIDADDIQLYGYRSLAEALRNQRSFFLHTDGLNWMLGDRGFLRPGEWNARILVTVDGRPTNDMIFGQSHLDRDFVVPMEAIKQIEIVRGPGSALYGTNAVFGVINVVTKDGADINGAQVKLEGGTQETGRASVLFGKVIDGWDIVASATGYSSEGDRDIIYDGVNDAAHDYGHVKDSDGENVESLFLKTRKGDLSLTLDWENRVKGNRSATYLTSFTDPGNMHEDRDNATLKYDHEIQTGQSIHAMAYYGHYGYAQGYGTNPSPPTPAYLYFTTAHDDWVGEEVHYDWQVNKPLHVLFGADGKQSLYTHQRDYTSLQGQVLNVSASDELWGVFTNAEYKVTDWLTMTGGLRLDGVQRIGEEFSPRLAAVVTVDRQDTVKLLYGRAFRAPNLYELLYYDPGANTPNPNLRPEIVDTYEAVWEREYEEGWRTSLGGFVWTMHDAMENFTFPDGSLQTRNGPTLWAHGVEAEISRKWSSGGSLRGYATFTRAEHDGNRLLDSPEWIVGGAISLPIYKANTFLSIDSQIVGEMKDDLGLNIQPTYLTNVVLTSKDFVTGWDLQIGAYNLFANFARLPRDGPFNQIQSDLNYPNAQYLIGVTHRF